MAIRVTGNSDLYTFESPEEAANWTRAALARSRAKVAVARAAHLLSHNRKKVHQHLEAVFGESEAFVTNLMEKAHLTGQYANIVMRDLAGDQYSVGSIALNPLTFLLLLDFDHEPDAYKVSTLISSDRFHTFILMFHDLLGLGKESCDVLEQALTAHKRGDYWLSASAMPALFEGAVSTLLVQQGVQCDEEGVLYEVSSKGKPRKLGGLFAKVEQAAATADSDRLKTFYSEITEQQPSKYFVMARGEKLSFKALRNKLQHGDYAGLDPRECSEQLILWYAALLTLHIPVFLTQRHPQNESQTRTYIRS